MLYGIKLDMIKKLLDEPLLLNNIATNLLVSHGFAALQHTIYHL